MSLAAGHSNHFHAWHRLIAALALGLLLAACTDPAPGEDPADGAASEGGAADLLPAPREAGGPADGGPGDALPDSQAGALQQVTGFGSNPGQLQMYEYRPADLPADAPLVVLLHPCEIDARTFARLSGWNELAEARQLYLLYPQQMPENNLSLCFNWFRLADQARDSGEAASIMQMIDHARSRYPAGATYLAGMSGGGAMAAALLAGYPEAFQAGAIVAGVPAGCARDLHEALTCMSGKDQQPETWAQLVHDAFPGYQGAYPRVLLFHGDQDTIVDPQNLEELIEQWTAVHGAPLTPDNSTSIGDHLRQVWLDAQGQPVVTAYRLSKMGHGMPVDPGSAEHQGGQTSAMFIDVDLWAAWHTAEVWGL